MSSVISCVFIRLLKFARNVPRLISSLKNVNKLLIMDEPIFKFASKYIFTPHPSFLVIRNP